jgi:putative membrane-bound dehydrogenase-like protein
MSFVTIVVLTLIGADPTPVDSRLVIERFAAEPDIVTPTGVAVDAKGRVLVIESHTHFRPQGYQGPPADRIRRFEDTDGDGKSDKVTTVFEGTKYTMSLAVDRDGSLVVATRNEIFRLRDKDEDGKFESKSTLARLDTPGNYPHNGLSGVVFDIRGNVLFGLGENLGADYKLIGSDGVELSGGGEGGNIYQCDSEGKGLHKVATGFWNPFALAFDAYGRLFCVDNDPDSRPPCRLLHIVPDGDYGYRFRNGRKGLHPFTAWNGELPGTLPMVAGTGEAPSGLIVYESDNLPDAYRGTILSTSWGDHRIERFRLEPRGASFRATAEPIVTGGDDFRPVGIAQAPDGSLYISDWVDKSYDLHGKGRVWHLRAGTAHKRVTSADPAKLLAHPDLSIRRDASRSLLGKGPAGRDIVLKAIAEDNDPRARAVALEAWIAASSKLADGQPPPVNGRVHGGEAAALPGALKDKSSDIRAMATRLLPDELVNAEHLASDDASGIVRAEALRRLPVSPAAEASALKTFESDDPFLLVAARHSPSLGPNRFVDLTSDPNPNRRLQALIALRECGRASSLQSLSQLLDDLNPSIRFAALQAVAENNLKSFRTKIADGLAKGATTRQLFEAYLATLARLDGEVRLPTQELAGEEYVASLMIDPKTSPEIRHRAIRMLRSDHPALTLARLKGWLSDSDQVLRLEAVRTLRESPLPRRSLELLALAKDPSAPSSHRAEAIVGLSGDSADVRDQLVTLASSADPAIRREALRSLRSTELSAAQRQQLTESTKGDADSVALIGMLSGPVPADARPKPSELDAWLRLLEGEADRSAGERVFFHPKGPGCYRCHSLDGRGGRAGPDLSTTAQTLDRRRLVESILEPSKEIAPQFVPWSIAKTDGTLLSGLLVEESPAGDQIYVDSLGNRFTVKSSEIAERKPQATSIMPDHLALLMTIAELRDLVAYLQSAK